MNSSQSYQFEAETERLLELLTHSIYSNKEIFLRELISNASDAIDKARFLSVKDPDYLGTESDLSIQITCDPEKKTLSIKDSGIGMTQEEMMLHLGTIAKSGTKDFIEKLKESQTENNLIGQFGVGFYSVFMVAKNVEVHSKSKDSEQAYVWISEGKGSYEIQKSEKKTRGTEIIISLKDDEGVFSNEWKIQELVTKYSNYIGVPVQLKKKKQDSDEMEWVQINETKAIWNRAKSELTEEDYQKFYTHISSDFEKYFGYIHGEAEGILSYKYLLYIPKKKNPFLGQDDPTKEYGPKLYVQNVLILESARDLLPVWLRFVQGVVTTNDLPLNISREMLQTNPNLEKIKHALTKKILEKIGSLQNENKETYLLFLENFSQALKEGIYYETEGKEKIAGLLRFQSLLSEEKISLDEYKAQIKEEKEGEKKYIYYILAKTVAEARSNPYIDNYLSKGINVLLLTDPIDEWMMSSITEYSGIPFQSILSSQGEEKEEKTPEETEKTQAFLPLFEGIKKLVGEDVLEEVRFSQRLGKNLGALTLSKNGITPQMEKMMRAMGQNIPTQKRILELNPDHSITKLLEEAYKENPEGNYFQDLANYTYEQAVLLEGGELKDAKKFIQRIESFLSRN